MLAMGAGGTAGSIVPLPGARGQPWRSKQRGRAQGRHLILGGTEKSHMVTFSEGVCYNGNVVLNKVSRIPARFRFAIGI
jgi:hypothetical protein